MASNDNVSFFHQWSDIVGNLTVSHETTSQPLSTLNELWTTTDFMWSESESAVPTAGGGDQSWSNQAVSNGCSRYQLVLYTFVLGAIALLGLSGNVLQYVVLWPERRKSATTVLLLLLAALDNLLIMTLLYQTTLPEILALDRGRHNVMMRYHGKLSRISWGLINTIRLINEWVTVLISLQRYLAVCWPVAARRFSSAKSAVHQTLFSILAVLVFNIPRFIEGYSRYHNVPFAYITSTSYTVGYKIWVYDIFMYIIPLCLLVATTCRIIHVLRKNRQKLSANNTVPVTAGPSRRPKISLNVLRSISKPKIQKEEQQAVQKQTQAKQQHDITVSVIVVVLIFIVCQIANPVREILEVFRGFSPKCGTFQYAVKIAVPLLTVLNSSVNFYVFCLCARGFRRKALTKLRCRVKVGPTSQVMTGQTTSQ